MPCRAYRTFLLKLMLIRRAFLLNTSERSKQSSIFGP